MKKFVLFFVAIFFVIIYQVKGQFLNVNPDPYGDPWMVFTGEDSLCFDPDLCLDYPPLILTEESKNKSLPYKIDNSEKIYFYL